MTTVNSKVVSAVNTCSGDAGRRYIMTSISLFYNIIKADNLKYNWLQTVYSRFEVSITSIYFEMLVYRLYN